MKARKLQNLITAMTTNDHPWNLHQATWIQGSESITSNLTFRWPCIVTNSY